MSVNDYYLYIVKCKKFAKVGISSNLKSRLEALNAFNPVEVKLVSKIKYHDKKSALMCEKELHKILKLKGYHIKYEWFEPFDKVLNEFFLFQEKFDSEILKKISDELHHAGKNLYIFLGTHPSSKKKSYVLRCLEKSVGVSYASYLMRSILIRRAIDINIAANNISALIQNIINEWDGD